ncbi:MAG TPA: hypothetical protein VI027_00755 [Rubrobacteraceae bacterium]
MLVSPRGLQAHIPLGRQPAVAPAVREVYYVPITSRDHLDRPPHPPHRPIVAGHRTLLSRGFDDALRGTFATESAAQHVGHEDHTEAQEGQGFEEPVLWWEASPSGVRVKTPKGSYEAERLVVAPGA